MSFILDALKKSENDRQRATGPALFEVRVAPPRSRFPIWAIAVGVLLVVNLGVVAWLVVRTSSPPATVAQTPVPTPAPSAPAPAAPASPALAAPAAATFSRNVGVQTVPEEAPQTEESFLSDDYAPAEEPVPDDSPPPSVQRGTVAGLPTYEKANQSAGGRIPELRMDMHVYAPKPQDRFVFVNMRKLKEGEALPEGVRVETITSDGAVLSWQGSRFTLARE